MYVCMRVSEGEIKIFVDAMIVFQLYHDHTQIIIFNYAWGPIELLF